MTTTTTICTKPTMFEQVVAFHEKFGLQYKNGPRVLDKKELEFRIECHREELREFEDAVNTMENLLSQGLHENHSDMLSAREEIFDALLDGIYFYLGTCHRMGFDAEEGFRRVNAANMSKKLPEQGTKTKRGWHMEVVKPEGWKPPNLLDLVTCQQWPDDNINEVCGLITLDGPDCSGKSTLAQKFVELYGAEYIHLTWSPALETVMDAYRINAIGYAIALSSTKLVILDRPWISQVIYAEVFRGGTKWPDLIEQCDKLLQAASALQIICLPKSVKEGNDNFANSGKSPNEELYKNVNDVVEAFIAVYDGDIRTFNPTSSKYLSSLMRDGGIKNRQDFVKYDMLVDGRALDTYVHSTVEALK